MSNSSPTPAKNSWVQPLIPLLVAVVSVALLYLGGLLAWARGATDDAALPLTRWVGVVVVAVVILYFLYVSQAKKNIWKFGTRQVVYAAIGAALYGVLSWLTNVVQLPSISLVALRPAIVIPVFFGVAFGPVVGFFSGFVGNILGDALTGWGVYPLWDVGNGILGLVAGFVLAFKDGKRSVTALTVIVAVVAVAASVLLALNSSFTVSDFNGTKNPVGPLWWLPLLGGGLVVVARFVFWKAADLAAAELWAAFGILVGIGFAAFGGILQNGTSPGAALFGEFVPAAGSNLVNSVILLPILLSAWNAARSRSGR